MTASTEPGLVLGSAGYMSPEQARGLPADARSDIFALGAILYEMLSGRRAFEGATAADRMIAAVKEHPPELSSTGEIPPALRRLVDHCLEKNPGERFQSARDLAYDLEALADASRSGGHPPLAPDGTAPRAARWGPAAAALAAACSLAALLAGHVVWKSPVLSPPVFHRLTFRRGTVNSARFAPDGQTIVYGTEWDGEPSRIFLKRPESFDAIPLTLPPALLLSISRAGELALLLNCRMGRGVCASTLAVAPLTGGSPRPLDENVTWAEYAPDGRSFALVRRTGGRTFLEFPQGKILYETSGNITYPRFSPGADRISFIDNPLSTDDRGALAVIDLAGKKTTLSKIWASGRGTAWIPSGREIWFSAGDSLDRQLRASTLQGQERRVASIPLSMTLRDISPEGRVLLTPENSGSTMIVQAPGESREKNLSWYGHSIASELSDDGMTILFTEESEAAGPTYAACLRRMDGSPPVRLGEGFAQSFSPDGRWVLSQLPREDAPNVLLPTGAGKPRPLPTNGLLRSGMATFFPDGRRILFSASEPGRGPRLWIQDIEGGSPRPATPEGVTVPYLLGSHAAAPDGKRFFALDSQGRLGIYTADGGATQPVPQMTPQVERPVRWSGDGRAIFIRSQSTAAVQILRIDLASGRKEVWKDLAPVDPAGMDSIVSIALSPDGRAYAYTPYQLLSDLYVVEGLR